MFDDRISDDLHDIDEPLNEEQLDLPRSPLLANSELELMDATESKVSKLILCVVVEVMLQ